MLGLVGWLGEHGRIMRERVLLSAVSEEGRQDGRTGYEAIHRAAYTVTPGRAHPSRRSEDHERTLLPTAVKDLTRNTDGDIAWRI